MSGLTLTGGEKEQFLKDLESDWQWQSIVECPWTTGSSTLSELYQKFEVGEIRNVLCLRLFASSLYEIANGPRESHGLLSAIFGEKLLREMRRTDINVYEALEQTTLHLAWKIQKSQIIMFRKSNPKHGWSSVRKILVGIFGNDNDNEKMVAGMFAMILKEVALGSRWLEESPVLRPAVFPDVFRFAFAVFNDTIGDCLRKNKKQALFEALASKIAAFYSRLAADTWRILVVRNGPKEVTEHYLMRCIRPSETSPLEQAAKERGLKKIPSLMEQPKIIYLANSNNTNRNKKGQPNHYQKQFGKMPTANLATKRKALPKISELLELSLTQKPLSRPAAAKSERRRLNSN